MANEPRKSEPSKQPANPEQAGGGAAGEGKSLRLTPDELKQVAGGAEETGMHHSPDILPPEVTIPSDARGARRPMHP